MKNTQKRLLTLAVSLAICSVTSNVWAGQFCTGFSGESASGSGASACGYNASASGAFSGAFGTSANASGNFSTATGGYANASGASSTATGSFSVASGDYSSATGANAHATGTGSTAALGGPAPLASHSYSAMSFKCSLA